MLETNAHRGASGGVNEIENIEYLLSHFPGAVSIYDESLTLLAANDLHYELAGVPQDRFGPGCNYADIVRWIAEHGGYGECADVDRTVAERVAAITQPHWRFERVHEGRHIAGYSTRTPSGGIICCQQDITEQKEIEQRLLALTRDLGAARDTAEAASRAKSDFLAVMSHEMRTPLNGILGMAELLRANASDPVQKSHLDIVVKSGRALLGLVNDVLDLSRLDAGRIALDPQPFDFRAMVEDTVMLLAPRQDSGVELFLRYSPDVPRMLVGDEARLRQIMTNLVGNAAKFTESGHILVDIDGRARGGSAALRVRVIDTGVGVPEDRQARIFDRFEQGDVSSTRKYDGAGLGLAICRELVEAMGGEIGLRSRAEAGSTFWFSLDLPVHAEDEAPPLPSGRALLVCDSDMGRDILSEALDHWGLETVCAAQDQAVDRLTGAESAGEGFDLVILDPADMDKGAVLAARIAAAPLSRPPSVLLLQPTGAEAAPAAAMVCATLTKPCRADALAGALRDILSVPEPALRAAS